MGICDFFSVLFVGLASIRYPYACQKMKAAGGPWASGRHVGCREEEETEKGKRDVDRYKRDQDFSSCGCQIGGRKLSSTPSDGHMKNGKFRGTLIAGLYT